MGTGLLKINLYLGGQELRGMPSVLHINDADGKNLHTLRTDGSGRTESIALECPDLSVTGDINSKETRFGAYDVEIPASNGYKRVEIRRVQIFEGITSVLNVHLKPYAPGAAESDIYSIPAEHGVEIDRDIGAPDNQPAIEIHEDIPYQNNISIPEFITVHLGTPNADARNVRVKFVDYIKNAVCSEIYPDWDRKAIETNVHCIVSLALNRVITLWYRSRGKSFDITDNPQFDPYYVHGREIYENIGSIVDDVFNQFIMRPGGSEPFFAAYCNGTSSACAGLSQWGSQALALQNYTPVKILRYYYPKDVQIIQAAVSSANEDIAVIPPINIDANEKMPAAVRQGQKGEEVSLLQSLLNYISIYYSEIPYIVNDGVFRETTRVSVVSFQKEFGLEADGIVGALTWTKLYAVYKAVRIQNSNEQSTREAWVDGHETMQGRASDYEPSTDTQSEQAIPVFAENMGAKFESKIEGHIPGDRHNSSTVLAHREKNVKNPYSIDNLALLLAWYLLKD